MHVGVARLTLRLPGNRSLKGKRQIASSVIRKVGDRFNVSIAEVADNDKWQTLTVGITCVSNDSRLVNQTLSHVVKFIQLTNLELNLLDYKTEVISGI